MLSANIIYDQFNVPDYLKIATNIKKGKSFNAKPPKINFHIFENENWKNKIISSTQNELPTPNLSLDATKSEGRIKYNYKKRNSLSKKNQNKGLIKEVSILQQQM